MIEGLLCFILAVLLNIDLSLDETERDWLYRGQRLLVVWFCAWGVVSMVVDLTESFI